MGLRGIGAKPVKAATPRKRGRKQAGKPWEAAGLTRAERVVAFIESLTITSGIYAGKPFKLRDWQRRIIEAIYNGTLSPNINFGQNVTPRVTTGSSITET